MRHLVCAQVLDIDEAQRVAEGEGQDLVEVSPLAEPPVCRLQDYNKAKYAAKLREKVGSPYFSLLPLNGPAQRPLRMFWSTKWEGQGVEASPSAWLAQKHVRTRRVSSLAKLVLGI